MISNILKSSLSLFALKGLNILSPLLIIPIITRSFEISSVGQLFYYQSIAIVLSLIVEYGFNLNGTKRVAETLSALKREQVFFKVFVTKLFLLIPLFLVCCLISINTESNLYDFCFIILAFLSGFAQGFTPSWYFHGMNEMPKAFWTEGRATIIYLLMSLGLIMGGAGIEFVIFSQFFSRFISYSPIYVKRIKYEVVKKYKGLIIKIIIFELKSGWSFFVFRLVSSLYTKTAVFFLGLYSETSSVANYSGAEKVAKGAAGLLSPISQALFPRMSYMIKNARQESKKLFLKAFFVLGGCAFLLSFIIYSMAGTIIFYMLGPEYELAISVLKILSVLPFVIVISNLFGVQLLLNLGENLYFNRVIYVSATVHLACVYFSVSLYGSIGMAVQIVVVESFVAVSMIILSLLKTNYWYMNYEK